MFAKSSLSSTAAVFMPGATGATVTESYMQQQYYTNNCEQMNSYGMGYGYNYDTYSQDAYGHGQQWVTNNWTKKPDVLNLDDFSDLSDSDDEAVANVAVAAVAKKVDTKVAPPEALVMECGSAEPAEEPSPCAISGKDAKDLEAESDTHETFGERTVSTSDISSASSEPEGEASEILENVYDLRFLLKCRTTSTEPPEVVYRAMAVEEPKSSKVVTTPELKPTKAPKESKEIRRKMPKSSSSKLEASENSWGAQQRRLKNADSKEQVSRNIKSILNKLTLEKFASLAQQLLDCGISSSEDLVVLIHEVFEKATTQHHFIDMYADLCVLLHEHFTAKPLEDKKMTFKRLLLDECQSSFERLLAPPANLETLPTEERTIAEVSYKTHMLGNIKLVGGLLARGMLAAKVGIAILEELMSNPTPEALESVCALLTAMGPTADRPEWPQKKALNSIFDQLAVIVKSKTCQTRERCLLKDLLDLRKNAWVDKRPKKLERAMTLKQVAEGGHAPTRLPLVRKVTTNTFDQEKFRQAIRSFLREVNSSDAAQAVTDSAVQRLRAAGTPQASKQPLELADFLGNVVQEGPKAREYGFACWVKIASDWNSEAVAQGVKVFVTDMAMDIALDVPNLSQILEEFHNILAAAGLSPAAQQALKGFQAK